MTLTTENENTFVNYDYDDDEKEMEIYNHVKKCTEKTCLICESSHDFIDVEQTKIR